MASGKDVARAALNVALPPDHTRRSRRSVAPRFGARRVEQLRLGRVVVTRAKARHPTRHAAPVLLVRRAEHALQLRLLVAADEAVVGDH